MNKTGKTIRREARGAAADPDLINDAVQALEDGTPVRAELLAPDQVPGAKGPVIEVELGGARVRYTALCREVVDRKAVLEPTLKTAYELDPRGILVTRRLTAGLADACAEQALPFMDTAGNAFLTGDGLHVFIHGRKAPKHRMPARDGVGANPTALRVVFAFLCEPRLVNAPYREIAGAAGVALGAVGKILNDLVARGYLADQGKKNGRRLIDRARLQDEWIRNYPLVLRPKLHPRRFTAARPDWWQEAQLKERDGAWWGGEVAANKLQGYLKPVAQTVYVLPEKRADLLRKWAPTYRLRPDVEGEIEVLDAFWEFEEVAGREALAPPLLVYADLLGTLDPRNREVAEQLQGLLGR